MNGSPDETHNLPLIPHEELERRLGDEDLIVVDVLPADSYRRAHIPGAINLPLADIPRLADEMLPDRGAEIVVYCASPT